MVHGGDIYTEGRLKGRQLLDFSSNINPLGVPGSFTNNIQEAVKNMQVYPDIQYRQSKEHICRYLNDGSHFLYPKGKSLNFKFTQEDLVLGNGAGEIIDIAIASLKSLCIVMPSFVEYKKSAQKNGVKIIYSHLNSNMEIDYDDLAQKIQEVEGLIIGNPNNPNGGVIDQVKFKPILEYCQKYNKRIIIDEAFIEFTGGLGASLLALAQGYSCICMIRALTKFYGMPGIRFGYSICKDRNYNDLMRKRQIPWNINSFAEIALQYVLEDYHYVEETLKWIGTERVGFLRRLKALEIFEEIYPTQANFVLVKLADRSGTALYEKLLKEGILIRICKNYEGLGDEYIRLAIKSRKDNLILLQSLSYIM
ncbi:MAG TPA: aminotransferase class I/II-fold pyridoxal phosphate-dependent enzyme [Epulopiscium sp.]|nr:aminotransferase class I/II-fold pyridoxal phosphate-dependent enzyme [Candidatus Epulonipiscium sp.]